MMVPEKSPELRRSWWIGCQARAAKQMTFKSTVIVSSQKRYDPGTVELQSNELNTHMQHPSCVP